MVIYKYTKQDLLDELHRVAKLLGQKSVSVSEMKKHGQISVAPYHGRFGSWNKAVFAAGLVPNSSNYTVGTPRAKREKINSKLKLAILDRDYHKCVLCGASPANDETVKLHADHIKPLSKGGKSTYFNLWILCAACNLKKSANYTSELSWYATTYLCKRLFDKELA